VSAQSPSAAALVHVLTRKMVSGVFKVHGAVVRVIRVLALLFAFQLVTKERHGAVVRDAHSDKRTIGSSV
jgi:hypothetical protein